jgi:hypothetical protein
MTAKLVAEEAITVGQPVVVEGPAPNTTYGAVFEDDGDTGYFYGLDFSHQEEPILDARHIYSVEQVTDRGNPSVVQIAWSGDGLKTGLFINRYPHAIIDFAARRSYCRTGFPPPSDKWSEHNAAWDDKAVELLR